MGSIGHKHFGHTSPSRCRGRLPHILDTRLRDIRAPLSVLLFIFHDPLRAVVVSLSRAVFIFLTFLAFLAFHFSRSSTLRDIRVQLNIMFFVFLKQLRVSGELLSRHIVIFLSLLPTGPIVFQHFRDDREPLSNSPVWFSHYSHYSHYSHLPYPALDNRRTHFGQPLSIFWIPTLRHFGVSLSANGIYFFQLLRHFRVSLSITTISFSNNSETLETISAQSFFNHKGTETQRNPLFYIPEL